MRFQAGPAAVVGSEATIPQELGRFQIQPSGCLSGLQFGYAFCRTNGFGSPGRGSLVLSWPMANFLRVFLIYPGEGGLLWVVSASPLMSKAGSGCVWEAGL